MAPSGGRGWEHLAHERRKSPAYTVEYRHGDVRIRLIFLVDAWGVFFGLGVRG